MNIRFLETAICLCQLRNFRATADALNITPAAVSSRIAAMEVELGFRLFDRDSRDVRPTSEGLSFVEGARNVVDRYNDLLASFRPQSSVAGSVRIGLVPAMASTLLPGIATTLREKFPNVQLSIVTDSTAVIMQKLKQGDIDIGICIAPPDVTGFRVVELCQLGMFWIVDPRNLTHKPTDHIRIDDLLKYTIISYEAGTYNHQRMIEYFSASSPESFISHYSNSLATTISMISAGIGISVLPPVCIQRELREGTLGVLPVHPGFPATKYSIIHLDRDEPKTARLATKIACEEAMKFCSLFDDSLASVTEFPTN
ncbi:LysR family transcriptional regulator [Azospirillum endophyticum]